MSWLKAINPSSPIRTEAEAERAARASAISIFIGVVVGLIGVAWTFANPQAMQDAIASASNGDASAAAAAEIGIQAGLWMGVGMVVIQLILGFIQWRNPGKFIAILFMVLIAFGIVSTLAAPMMAASMPNVPVTPMWQIALSIAIMIIQFVMHIAGLRGISQRDRIQMEQANR